MAGQLSQGDTDRNIQSKKEKESKKKKTRNRLITNGSNGSCRDSELKLYLR